VAITDHEEDISYLLTLLTPEEIKRSQRFHQLIDRQRFVIGRGVLRLLLGSYLSIPPLQLTISQEKKGKLFATEALERNIHFNLSHSGNWILIAIDNKEVGVDVEKVFPDFYCEEMMHYNFSPAERVYIQQSHTPVKEFFQFWTRKEALLKATGVGLINNLPGVSCLIGTNYAEPALIASDRNWHIATFPVDEDHMGSLACQPGVTYTGYHFNLSSFLSPRFRIKHKVATALLLE
jgi:4'-phosphopantetheinyl transferase